MKAPDGVNDVQVAEIGGVRHFIVSFGSMIKVLSSEFKLVSKFLVPFNVLKIHPYQDHYFLIGRGQYHVYKGTRKVREQNFAKSLNKINKILAIRNFLIILHDGHYSLAKIQEMGIKLEDTLTDSTFFTPLSAEKIDELIYILARTYSRKYLITYSIENNAFKCHRREVSNGNFMFGHFGKIIFLDEKGMWHMREKLSYIKDFGNYRVSCAISVGEKSLLFCKNGEILQLNGDYKYEVLGLLDCSIDVVSTIDGLYFCGSQSYSYLLRISDKSVQIIKKYVCIGNSQVIRKDRDIELICNKDFVVMKYAIPSSPRSLISSGMDINSSSYTNDEPAHVLVDQMIPAKRSKRNTQYNLLEKEAQDLQALSVSPKRFFKGNSVTIMIFEKFSIVNGIRFGPINNYSSCGDKDVFNTFDSIFEVNCSGKSFVYRIASSTVKYFGPMALIFKKNVVSILDTDTKSLRSYNISFELCDFCMWGGFVYCIDFDEHVHKIHIEDFCDCNLEWTTTSLSQLSVEFGTTEQMIGKEIDNEDPQIDLILDETRNAHDQKLTCTVSRVKITSLNILNANGKLFYINDGHPDLIADVGSFISYFAGIRNTLVVLADQTYALNLTSKKISIVDFNADASFVYGNQLYLYGKGNLIPFEWANPVFTYKKIHCGISNTESLVCMVDGGYVYSYPSLDRKTVNYRLNDSILSFPSHIESCRYVVRDELICTALVNVDTKSSKLVFITIKNKKLRVREEIPQPLVPLSICSFKNTIVSVCPDQLIILKSKNNKIRRIKYILDRNDLCAGSFFTGRSSIIVFNDDWSFKTVDLKKGTIKKMTVNSKCIPFALNKTIGYAAAHKIHLPNSEMDCVEDISSVVSASSEVLIFGKNGSVFRLKEVPDEERVDHCTCETE